MSITPLALRTSRAANGVSQRHGEVARSMWRPLWPGRPADGGADHARHQRRAHRHVDGGPDAALLDRHLGPDWRAPRRRSRRCGQAIDRIPNAELWEVRCQLRRELVELVRERSILDRLSRGEGPRVRRGGGARVRPAHVSPSGLRAASPPTSGSTCWCASPSAAGHLLDDGPTPIQLVIAGKAHPQDHEGKQTLNGIFQSRGRAVFGRAGRLSGGLRSAHRAGDRRRRRSLAEPAAPAARGQRDQRHEGGAERRPQSQRRRWLVGRGVRRHQRLDHRHAAGRPARCRTSTTPTRSAQLMQNEVVPLFYARGPDGVPHLWLQRVKASMRGLIPRFNAERMLLEYVRQAVHAPPAGREQPRRAPARRRICSSIDPARGALRAPAAAHWAPAHRAGRSAFVDVAFEVADCAR